MIDSSENFDISLITGKVLNQVCIGLYEIILNFEDNISVSCESKMYILNDKTAKDLVFPPPGSSIDILRLLGKQIVGVELDKKENLLITFPSDISLEIESVNEGYESFHVWIGNNFLIV